MTRVTIELPDDVARSAQQAGLLSSQTLASVVRELVREQSARELRNAIQAIDKQPVTEQELTAEDIRLAIAAARRH
jgi:Arc/MetJ family transcription regulator